MRSEEKALPIEDLREDLEELLQGQSFTSMEEVQAVVRGFMDQRQSGPIDDFHGLSPDQMHQLLYSPFDSPGVIRFNFNAAVTKPDDAPLVRLLQLIVQALGDKGIRTTAQGNLPRAVSRDIARQYLTTEEYEQCIKYREFMKESDVPDLNPARMISELAGFIRKHGGKLTVTAKCRRLIDANSWGAVYEMLFRTYIDEFNWAYPVSAVEQPFFQQSFGFTLFLLHKYGKESRPDDFYQDCFVKAFPRLLDGIDGNQYFSGESILKFAYWSQAIYGFGRLTGLVSKLSLRANMVIAQPLLYRLVAFGQ